MKIRIATGAGVAGLALAPFALGLAPVTEDFSAGDANWRGVTEGDVLSWFPTGGVDNGGYVSNSFNFVDTPGDLPEQSDFQTLFRGQDNLDSSGDAFVGDYRDLDTLSFFVRHDAQAPLQFLVRLAQPLNFPAVVYPAFTQFVAPGTWTEIQVPLDGNFPWVIASGDPTATFDGIASNIGNVQIAVNDLSSTGLPGLDQDITFDLDRVSLIPAPGAAGLLGLAGLAAVRRRR
jgi:hypothetical protein